MVLETLFYHNHLQGMYILTFSFYREGTEKLSYVSQVIEHFTGPEYLPVSQCYGPTCPTVWVIHKAGAGLGFKPRSFLKG